MLKPAIAYRDEILQKANELYYSEDYFYYIGDVSCYQIEIRDSPERGCYQFASVDKNGNLAGYIAFMVDFYCETAYNFGLLSFDKGNMTLAADLNEVLKDLLNNPTIHRITWSVIGGNPIEHTYDRFCERHHGTKHIFHRVTRDKYGKFHDENKYEIIC